VLRAREAGDRLEASARLTALAVVLLAALAVIDLATGSLVDEPRMDVGLLIACGLGLWGALGLLRIARRLRQGPMPPGMSAGQWVWFVGSSAVGLAVMIVVGYLFGGWWVAFGFPAAVLVTTAVVVLAARRRTAS
jgi:peptidoglycan/LPS O-acetylase OafA/YrhL